MYSNFYVKRIKKLKSKFLKGHEKIIKELLRAMRMFNRFSNNTENLRIKITNRQYRPRKAKENIFKSVSSVNNESDKNVFDIGIFQFELPKLDIENDTHELREVPPEEDIKGIYL
eukprot:TRINITY_DN29981_c0_g1_i1.p1 TRINITY_DN29981_c0_g1~~TRINITY_DN29981_c0_g1_i1.p1  ORF type:complete len:131 (-),score=4.23 TRINITY_DN29981_c0_g1_i1:41-385(-)